MLGSPVARLRLIGLTEGLSFVALLFVAMPLKYALGMPLAVRIVGMAHGVLFLAYCVALADAARARKWSAGRTAGLFAASLLPFGPIVADRWLKREQEQSALLARE